jgi:hypothetical protein
MWYTGIKCGYDLLYVKICDNNKLQRNVLPLLTAMERKNENLIISLKTLNMTTNFPSLAVIITRQLKYYLSLLYLNKV